MANHQSNRLEWLDAATRARSQGGALTRRVTSGWDLVDLLCFLVPCLQFIQIQLVGTMNASDLVLLAVFFYLAISGKIRIAPRSGKRLMVLGLLWLASQVVTDIVRHAAFANYARGWSLIALTLMDFAVLCTLLYGRPRRLMLYGWGLAIGWLLTYFISPYQEMKDYPWKFGVGYPVVLAACLFASSKSFRASLQIGILAIVGAFGIYMGTRAYGGACLGAALYLLLTGFLRGRSGEGRALKARTIVMMAASVVLGLAGIVWAYGYAARTGWLGQDAQDKYQFESKGKYGLILGGRIELLGEIPAIRDSPILGHGSWTSDPEYLLVEHQELARLGYTSDNYSLTDEQLREGYIPHHSYIFGAWVDGGILGAVFWGWVFVLIARIMMRVYPATVTLLPLAAYVAFLTMWNILFSPMGLMSRIIDPYYLVLLMTCAAMAARATAPAATDKTKKRQARAHVSRSFA